MITLAKDAYTWTAFYSTDSAVYELDRPEGRGFAEVEKPLVKALGLDSETLPCHRAIIPESAEPIFFRRRSVEIKLSDESQMPRSTIHCIGWRRDDLGVYLFVFEDGSCLLSNDLQAV